MKKVIFFMAVTALSLTMAFAQNSFKGIVKYRVESTGNVAFQVPEDAAKAEIMVFGDDLYTTSKIFMTDPFTEAVLVHGLKATYCVNYSQLLDYLRNQGSEFSYSGKGKLLIKHDFTQGDIDSLTIPDTEPGHFYFEYIDGETKEIAGVTAKKVIQHAFDVEGKDHPTVMWYSDEMGPQHNFLFMGIKGMPLLCTQDLGEGKQITYTATDIVKGKVKEADFLLPDGYESINESDLKTFVQELQEELELMNE